MSHNIWGAVCVPPGQVSTASEKCADKVGCHILRVAHTAHLGQWQPRAGHTRKRQCRQAWDTHLQGGDRERRQRAVGEADVLMSSQPSPPHTTWIGLLWGNPGPPTMICWDCDLGRRGAAGARPSLGICLGWL